MNFIYPSFLWATSLIAIPILIHLFNFQRAKKVYFTNVEFLKEIKSVSSAQNKLRHLVVLLMRCLFIICLALAFAQPYLPAPQALNAASGNRHVSVYVDNSFSMQAEKDNKKLLDMALPFGEQVIGLFPKNTQFQVLNNSFEGSMNYFTEAKKASENINKLSYSTRGRNLKNIYDRQKQSFYTHAGKEGNFIFWISDFQKSNFNNLIVNDLDSTNTFYLVPTQAEVNSNLYVDSLWLENPFIKLNENNTLYVKVNHFGKQGVSERAAKLFIDGKQVSNGMVSLEANGTMTLKMNFAVQTAGIKHCKITLDDSPILFDNEYFFTLHAAPLIKIVQITDAKNKASENFVQNVYAQEVFFQLQTVTTASIDYNALQNANLIILQDLENIDNALLSNLQKFISKKGSLVVFPHENFNSNTYSSLLGVGISSSDGQKLELTPPDIRNPFYSGIFERITATMNMPQCQQIAELGSGGQTLLKFKNEKPFLKWYNNRNANLFVFATSLQANYSDLGKHAIFLPLMYKIALHSTEKTERMAYNFEENLAEITLTDSLINKNELFKLVDLATNNEFIPTQRIVENKLLVEIPKTSNLLAGNYNIVRKTDNKIVGGVALNYSKTESIADCYSNEELKTLFAQKPNIQVFTQGDVANFASQFQEKNIAKPLWRYLIMAALAFLLAEVVLLRWRNNL